jgi:predicted O-methyltransferase YrrM
MPGSDAIERFATAIGPRSDEVLTEMDRRAAETGFPTVGPAVGGWLQLLAGFVGAERVFEFGSGFGYSAYWFARALPADGEIVLTEIDADELESAREYLDRGGYADRARFELGDAIETIDRYEGPFDVVLIDNEKERYVEAFEAVRSKIPVGGAVVADNAMEGPFEFETMRRLFLDDERPSDIDEPDAGLHLDSAQGIVAYLERLRSTESFETVLLPLGEGLVVSRRVQ